MNLVIVESPAKAKTINGYLGKDYEVLASFGHVRDLPAKDGSVDPDKDFAMLWEVEDRGAKRLAEIGRAVKGADKIILATDPDREGEAISWHVLEVLRNKKLIKDKPVERVVFNAITKSAIREAMNHPREVDQALVDAYLARRALDYLVGFNLSPVLWRKLPGARSAGRVQSVALRLVCDREREIEVFKPREYWSILAHLKTQAGAPFEARLVGADGKKITRLDVGTGAEAKDFRAALEAAAFTVARRRVEAGQAPPLSAVPHLDPAAGRVAQARAFAEPHDADRPETLRGHRPQRRDAGPHHLHADRRRRHGAGGDHGRAQDDRRPCMATATCPQAPRKYTVRPRTRRKPTRRSGPTDFSRAAARRGPLPRSRAGQALRADLEAHGGQPDGIGRARTHDGRHRGRRRAAAVSTCAPPAR